MKHAADDLSFLREDPHETWPDAWRRLAFEDDALDSSIMEAHTLLESIPAMQYHGPAKDMLPHGRSGILRLPVALAAMAAALVIIPFSVYMFFLRTPVASAVFTVDQTSATASVSLAAGAPQALPKGTAITQGSMIQSDDAEINLSDGDGLQLRLGPATRLEVERSAEQRISIILRQGELQYISDRHKALVIHTSRAEYIPEGTAFSLRSDDQSDLVNVSSGHVRVKTALTEETLAAGMNRRIAPTGSITEAPALNQLGRDLVIFENGSILYGTVTKVGPDYFIDTGDGQNTITHDRIREIRMHDGAEE